MCTAHRCGAAMRCDTVSGAVFGRSLVWPARWCGTSVRGSSGTQLHAAAVVPVWCFEQRCGVAVRSSNVTHRSMWRRGAMQRSSTIARKPVRRIDVFADKPFPHNQVSVSKLTKSKIDLAVIRRATSRARSFNLEVLIKI